LTPSPAWVTIPAFARESAPNGLLGVPSRAGGAVTHVVPMSIPAALALAASTPPSGGAPPQGSLLPLLIQGALIFLVFYFLVIRPARTRQKEHATMLDALKPGDKVVCAGGIHATVVGVTDATVQVRIADQVRIDVERASITTIKNPV